MMKNIGKITKSNKELEKINIKQNRKSGGKKAINV